MAAGRRWRCRLPACWASTVSRRRTISSTGWAPVSAGCASWAAPSVLLGGTLVLDKILAGTAWMGVGLGAILLIGRLERLALVLLYVLYLSFSVAGQEFLSFQWDALLLEVGFLAIFFGRTRTTQKTIAWLYRWLAFRLYFLSGFVKLASHDPTWRNLSALDFHYWTQPLPTVVAWYADKLPRGFQHASTFMVLAIELGARLS